MCKDISGGEVNIEKHEQVFIYKSKVFRSVSLKTVKNSAAPLALCVVAFDTALDSLQ